MSNIKIEKFQAKTLEIFKDTKDIYGEELYHFWVKNPIKSIFRPEHHDSVIKIK